MLKLLLATQAAFCALALYAFASAASGALAAPAGDDLETYRACVLRSYSDARLAKDSLAACQHELAEWSYSPTFANEWNKLLSTDSRVAEIIGEFYLESIPLH